MSERDLLIGVVTYDRTWDDIKVWYKSARDSGYTGDITILIYGGENREQYAKHVDDLSFDLKFIPPDNENIKTLSDFMTWRFKWIYDYLKSYSQYRYVCITDVNDVVFQDDWSVKCKFFDDGVIVGGENLKYADEPWSRHNMLTCFGSEEFADIRDEEIQCAGVIAGTALDVRGFCLCLWALAHTGKPSANGGGPDQAAMNILLSETGAYNAETIDFIAHLGTHSEAIKAGSGDVSLAGVDIFEKFIGPEHEIYDNEGDYSVEFEGRVIPIVHQYNRIPYLKEFFRNKYA